MTRVAITGGRSRLAPGLAAYLAALGWKVDLFSRQAGPGYHGIESLLAPGGMAEFGAVVHLAWSSVPLLSEEDPGIEEREDYPFARALAGAASACLEPPLIVFASSAAVYGNTGTEPVDEALPCLPLGRYAAAKLAAEAILASAPRCCSLRITNVFGAGDALSRPQGIIPRLIDAALSGREVTIWGDGMAQKDYLAAPDLHAAFHRVLESGLTGIFNVASGHVMSVNQLVALVEESTGRPVRLTHAPHFSWDVEKSIVSAAALWRRACWRALLDPEAAIAGMVASAAGGSARDF